MELLENIAEYYDELFPASEEIKSFIISESKDFPSPVKYLSIGCGTGSLEHHLAKTGADVTGLETVTNLIESANRKRRTQLMALRFFQMSSLEMSRFLGKDFYNMIFIPYNRIIFTADSILMAKLFYDCRQLLAKNGKLILHLLNFDKFSGSENINLPLVESIRVKLFSRIQNSADGKKKLFQELETGSGRRFVVSENAEILPLTKNKIENYGKNAGFSKFSFYGDFSKGGFSSQSDELIVVIS